MAKNHPKRGETDSSTPYSNIDDDRWAIFNLRNKKNIGYESDPLMLVRVARQSSFMGHLDVFSIKIINLRLSRDKSWYK